MLYINYSWVANNYSIRTEPRFLTEPNLTHISNRIRFFFKNRTENILKFKKKSIPYIPTNSIKINQHFISYFFLKFSFKLVTFSKSYARKQKWLLFLNTVYNVQNRLSVVLELCCEICQVATPCNGARSDVCYGWHHFLHTVLPYFKITCINDRLQNQITKFVLVMLTENWYTNWKFF